MMYLRPLILACVTALLVAPALAASPTLDKVHAAGELACGVIAEPEDYTKADLHGALAPLSAEI